MRALMWFVIGYCAGIASGIWVFDSQILLCVTIILAIAAIALRFLYSPQNTRRILAVCLLGIAVGIGCYSIYAHKYLETPKSYDEQALDLTITATDYSTVTTYSNVVDGDVLLDGTKFKIKIYIDKDIIVTPGDIVEGSFYLHYTGQGGSGASTFRQGEGIYLLGYPEGDLYVYAHNPSKFIKLQTSLRKTLKTSLNTLFPKDTEGFATALLLGDASGLSHKTDNDFQNSGIRHIIAVSGLHVSILISMLGYLLQNRRGLLAMIGLPVLFVFAAITGFTPSVIRACVMQSVLLFTDPLNQHYDSPTALSFAVLIILGINPLAIVSVSFQLSVGCVIGILLFQSKIHSYITSRKWLGKFSGKTVKYRIKRWIASSISVSLSAMFLTIPLSAHYFGTVCTLGVLTNLLTLWVISFIFCGLVVALLTGWIYLPFGAWIASIVSLPMRYVMLVAGYIAKIPFSFVSAENIYIIIWLILGYCMIIFMLFSKEKHPVLLFGCLLTGLMISLLLNYAERKDDNFRMTVLDVGQGQCIILQCDNSCYVLDCGGSSGEAAGDLAARTLKTQGISHIDGLILTHYDTDHTGGVNVFMSQIEVDHLLLPDVEPDNPIRMDLELQYTDRIQWIYEKQYLTAGQGSLTLIPAPSYETGNNSSMSILFQAEDCDILVTGDLHTEGEKHLLSSIRLPEIDILVLGHHGADDSTSMYLLNTAKPSVAVISVGQNNYYSHPHIRTLQRLEIFGCKVWRTDQNGTITFRR